MAAGSLVGCNRKAKQEGEAVKQSFDGLKVQFAELKKRFKDLRTRVESISPPDLPGFQDARTRFYAVEEARGTTDAKMAWLTGRLDAALSSGNRDELQEISKELVRSQDDIRKIDEIHTKLLHQMMAFERMAEQEKQAAAATASNPPPPPPPATAKPKRTKSKP